MRITACTYSTVICRNEWSSCRYTKGEGFDLLDNASGVFVRYLKVYCDDPEGLSAAGFEPCCETVLRRIERPELTYLIDVERFGMDDVPEVPDSKFTVSRSDAIAFVRANGLQDAEICDAADGSFSLVFSEVVLEAFSDAAL